jgi:hypothetical protein
MYPRTNPEPFGASENSNLTQIEEAVRRSVRQNSAHMRHKPENTSQVVTDINLLVQRVAEISDYFQRSETAMGSTKNIADNIVLWKETATRQGFAGAKLSLPSIKLEAKPRS